MNTEIMKAEIIELQSMCRSLAIEIEANGRRRATLGFEASEYAITMLKLRSAAEELDIPLMIVESFVLASEDMNEKEKKILEGIRKARAVLATAERFLSTGKTERH